MIKTSGGGDDASEVREVIEDVDAGDLSVTAGDHGGYSGGVCSG